MSHKNLFCEISVVIENKLFFNDYTQFKSVQMTNNNYVTSVHQKFTLLLKPKKH